MWLAVTGETEAATRALCDLARRVLKQWPQWRAMERELAAVRGRRGQKLWSRKHYLTFEIRRLRPRPPLARRPA